MERNRALNVRFFADGVGILGSAACAFHCLAAPVFLVVGTVLPTPFSTDESFHETMLWAIFPAAALAFGLGCWHHKDRRVLLFGIFGVLGISSPFFVPYGAIGETGERWVTLASAGLLIAAHLRNFRRCREDGCEHPEASSKLAHRPCLPRSS